MSNTSLTTESNAPERQASHATGKKKFARHPASLPAARSCHRGPRHRGPRRARIQHIHSVSAPSARGSHSRARSAGTWRLCHLGQQSRSVLGTVTGRLGPLSWGEGAAGAWPGRSPPGAPASSSGQMVLGLELQGSRQRPLPGAQHAGVGAATAAPRHHEGDRVNAAQVLTAPNAVAGCGLRSLQLW